MTAFELMSRMSLEEMRTWVEYDRTTIRPDDYRFAALMCQIEWHKGVKHPNVKKYLPEMPKSRKRKRTFAELKAAFDCAAAMSTRAKTRPHHAR